MYNTTCQSFPDRPQDCDVINTVRRVLGGVSCISCLFVFFVIWVFGRYSSFSQRLIVYLSVATFFNGLGRLFQDSKNEYGGWCEFQAWWLSYFNYTVMLWVCCIAFNLYMNVMKNVITHRFEMWYHGVCWIFTLVASVFPFIGNHYTPSGSWCWISDTGWQMGTWYVPLFVVVVGLLVVYGYIIFTVYRRATRWEGTHNPDTEREQVALREDIKPLRLYPCVYLILSIFPLVNRIQNAFSDNHIFALVLLHCITASMQGAAYSLIFAIDRDTLRSLTPLNIKIALQKKFAAPMVIQEYNVGDANPNGETPGQLAILKSDPDMENGVVGSNA